MYTLISIQLTTYSDNIDQPPSSAQTGKKQNVYCVQIITVEALQLPIVYVHGPYVKAMLFSLHVNIKDSGQGPTGQSCIKDTPAGIF